MIIKGNDRPINLTKKTLSEFIAGDSIYISKMNRGYSEHYLCEFISLDKGVVKAKIVGIEYNTFSKLEVGDVITARPSKCYLYGSHEQPLVVGKSWNRCNWFKDTKTIAGVGES